MISIEIILTILALHFFADFVLQTDKVAKNKSSDNVVLTFHVLWYLLPFMFVFGPVYAIVNGVLHWITDFFSSRATSYLWKKEETHWFFVVIGFDQLIHMATLFLTYIWLIK